MTTGKALNGKPYAGNPHIRFDEGEVASAATPRRGSLLYNTVNVKLMVCAAMVGGLVGFAMSAEPALDTFISHRGESVDAPENTLPAYRTAVERNFGFECDIYLSADKRVFTFHDRTLTRTSGGANTKKCNDATWDEVSKLDVGNWGKWRGSKFAGTRPALLEEVLELARDGRWLYIDVKSKSAEIVPYVKAIFEKQKRANPKNTLFLCGSVECGKAFKKLMPEYKVLSCLNCCKGWKKGAPPEPVENIIATTREMGADGVDLRFIRSVTTPEYMKAIKDAGLELHVWTVDDLADAVEAFKRGAQTVTTNCAKKLLDEYNASLANAGLSLEDGFKAPPASAKPHTWYHMMNGNVTKEGITCDFEALAKAGIGGVQMFDAGCAIPPGPLKFNSDDWFDMFAHAHKEAKRLGLEICIPNCSGWSSSGGPWNPPANGMKVIRFTETKVAGPRSRWSATLPREKKDNGFYDDIAVLAYPTPKGSAQLSNLPEKMFAKRGGVKRDTKPVADDALVAKDAVIDLTSKMKKDGALEWDVPAGDWTILRIGYICNGRCNHPASEKGRGLEVDKLSASAMDYHFAQYVTRLCKTLGIEPGKIGETGFNNILVDSYEVDVQNWTQGFDKTFEKRMGYSLTRYLPVFAGRIVGSVEESERFLEDFRRVVADLFAENYAGRLTELCHRHGLLCSIEPYGNCPADNLQYGQDIDIPMAEYWSTAAHGAHHSGGIGNSRLAATLAHVWGRRYAATESFTASPGPGGRWLTTPYSIKAQGDKVFAAGVNRIIYHRFTHQPWPGNKYLPGMTMGRWGMHLDRTQTWWPLVGDWFRYQTRCQWMLQEGKFAADVLFWCGEAVPLGGTDTKLPDGYDYDYCATKAFLELKVENGRVVAPGGVSYALLVLPKTDTMSEVCVKKVGELLDAGAKISSVSRPVRTPGLRGWNGGAACPQAAADDIEIEIKVTNLWPNRIIGDDTLYADDCVWMGKTRRGVKEFGVREIPQWVKEGKPSPTGRHTFTTWRHWSKEDDLLPSGLIGPVMLRGGVIAK